MICILAMVVFSILGLFSARYRPLAKEAVSCVLRKVTLRPCETNLDQRLKGQVTGKLMTKHPKVAKFTYKHFEALSFIFLILTLVSFSYSAYAVYNLAIHGTCNPAEPETCIFPDISIHGCDCNPCTDLECAILEECSQISCDCSTI